LVRFLTHLEKKTDQRRLLYHISISYQGTGGGRDKGDYFYTKAHLGANEVISAYNLGSTI
jgi:hypothetical protein